MNLSNLTKKFLIILVSSFYFLTSSFMPFAVAYAADPAPSTWYNQRFTTSILEGAKKPRFLNRGSFTDWYAKVYGDESPPSEI